MYGSRSREGLRQAVRRREQSATNARGHVERAYATMHTKRKMVPQMREELARLEARMKECRGPASLRAYQEMKAESARIVSAIDEIEKGLEARGFFERALPLLQTGAAEHQLTDTNIDQKREALAMSMFHPEKAVPVFIQTDMCTACGRGLTVRAEESMSVCPSCHSIQRVVQLATDHVDVDYMAQDTHANHTRSTHTGGVDASHADDSFANPTLYQKFLMQFNAKVPSPPDAVKDVILRELSKVHIHHGTKAQSTPINLILRKQNLKEWAWMSTRIAFELKRKAHEPQPTMSDDLIDRLRRRFECLLDALKRSNCRHRKKVFNFKFITKVFLAMEGEHALAELFENHKTRTVLRRENKRVGEGSQILEKEMNENGFSWKFFRSL